MKRILILICVFCLLPLFGGCGTENELLTVTDVSGEVLAMFSYEDLLGGKIDESPQAAYLHLVFQEASRYLAQKDKTTQEEALTKLFLEKYTLKTAFDPALFRAAQQMWEGIEGEKMPLECAILNSDGKVCAVFQGGSDQAGLTLHSPFSTIKPLAVYAPAVEEGIADWSTTFPDRPYKKLQGEDGTLSDWPANATGTYWNRDIPLSDCLKYSLNTASVHALDALGVKKSVAFLKNAFSMELSFEERKLLTQGEEEVIGNLALGYLQEGVSAVDLAGYYLSFANLGSYRVPTALTEICSARGRSVLKVEEGAKRVMSEETAYLMNRLLASVTEPGGTGEKAHLWSTELFGKTGTGVDGGGNWFVGVTPEYSCALWHGEAPGKKNEAASLFAKLFEGMPTPTRTAFAHTPTVEKGVFCSESGKMISPHCNQIHIGYYAKDRIPTVCDRHG